ncbi:MAG: uracil-DNA glycosylase [Zymomonas mobilis]|uniref:Type-5 uracil-DNA glycosylase n=1 Tax=Zymomonas mobilis TaxID=542 RepID=A0A542W302_ZYMMB|nr:uracil-DNA glycosylase [Zymomonas mobilis]TQL17951.1 uracil-DNA glycosylase family 4 [Zymomonas mobilis]
MTNHRQPINYKKKPSQKPKGKEQSKISKPKLTPDRDCPLCPRLASLRHDLQKLHPDWFNGPVPPFGDADPWLAIVGLAPGMKGANCTGRPFTGDFAGILLYETLLKYGLATGEYKADIEDGLQLKGAVILNSVRCLPPENKPTTQEMTTCRPFFQAAMADYTNLKVILALGHIAHQTILRAYGIALSSMPFKHGVAYQLSPDVQLIDSYHCSRYNQNTRRLTADMFEEVFQKIIKYRKNLDR